MHQQEHQVRQYYDRNTSRFLGLVRSNAPKTIHQPLYLRKDMSLEEALHTQHHEILHTIPDTHGACTLLDLGCGVGESMIYLAQHTPAPVQFVGITISGAQVSQANARISASGLNDRIQVIEGSFQSIPARTPKADIAYAIEAFIHSPDPSQFFTQVAGVLKSGGRLILFDDFLHQYTVDQHEQKIVDDLKNGWLANTLLKCEEVIKIARDHGFQLESRTDFSSALRLGRVRDRFIHLLVPVARLFMTNSQYCRFLVGGDARQKGYQKDLLRYEMVVFNKN